MEVTSTAVPFCFFLRFFDFPTFSWFSLATCSTTTSLGSSFSSLFGYSFTYSFRSSKMLVVSTNCSSLDSSCDRKLYEDCETSSGKLSSLLQFLRSGSSVLGNESHLSNFLNSFNFFAAAFWLNSLIFSISCSSLCKIIALCLSISL